MRFDEMIATATSESKYGLVYRTSYPSRPFRRLIR